MVPWKVIPMSAKSVLLLIVKGPFTKCPNVQISLPATLIRVSATLRVFTLRVFTTLIRVSATLIRVFCERIKGFQKEGFND